MEWITREGTQEARPEDLDTTSSETTVYFRRNQHQNEEADEQQEGSTVKKWVYEEAEMSREEYNRQQSDLSSPLAKAILQANNELIAKNELLQIEIEMLLDLLTPAVTEEGEGV